MSSNTTWVTSTEAAAEEWQPLVPVAYDYLSDLRVKS